MNKSNRPFLPNSNLQEKIESDHRKDNALFIINSINKAKSTWMKSEMIKNLYFYLDFDFVKKWLIDFYKETDKESIKQTIKGLYDGSLDLTDLIEQAKLNEEHFQESDRIIKEYEQELSQINQQQEMDLNSIDTIKVFKYLRN